MPERADPWVQRRLLELADADRAIATAEHRRSALPELAIIANAQARADQLRSALIVAQTEVGDLDRAEKKLEGEIDQVRARSGRDAERLAAGSGPAKELENLQREIESLARRQSVLEEESLELMERRETADAALGAAQREMDAIAADGRAAESRRDDAFADLDDELGRLRAGRAEIVAALPEPLLTIYQRVRRSGGIAAAELIGNQCGACRIVIDNVALAGIRGAATQDVVRCPECGAILIRA